MSDTNTTSVEKNTIEFILGCDPKVHIQVLQEEDGNLVFKVTSLDPEGTVTDLDALFFNFVDPDVVGSVGLWSPDATSAEFVDDGLNTLTDGTELLGDYDGRVEFGTGDTGVEGEVSDTTFFAIWADRPLTLEDLDLESFSMVVNSETDEGQVLTYNEGADASEDLREHLYGDWDFSNGEWTYVGPREEEPEIDDCTNSFVIEGDVNIGVTLTELENGNLQVDLQVLNDTGQIGDLQGLFFSLNDDSLTDGLAVTGDDVSGSRFMTDNVKDLGGGVNVSGSITSEAGKFDGGIKLGSSGMASDDIQSTTFILSHETEVLTLEDFSGQPMAVRLTSVGEDREESLKLLGYVTEGENDMCCDAQYSLGDVIPLVDEVETQQESTSTEDPVDELMFA